MSDETMQDAAPEAAPANEADRVVNPEDIKVPSDLRRLMEMAAHGLLMNAQKKMQSTGYHEAVQIELAIHKGDMHQFALHRLVDFVEKQDARIGVLESLLSDIIKKGAN